MIVAFGISSIYAGTTVSGKINLGSSFTISLDTPENSNGFNLVTPLVVIYRIVKLRYVSCSCVNSFVEYGIATSTILDFGRPNGGRISKLFALSPTNRTGPSHRGHIEILSFGLCIGIVPHATQIGIVVPSERSIKDSFTNDIPPCAIIASRSISPILRPPCAPRPPVG